jgi:hypothetical protein
MGCMYTSTCRDDSFIHQPNVIHAVDTDEALLSRPRSGRCAVAHRVRGLMLSIMVLTYARTIAPSQRTDANNSCCRHCGTCTCFVGRLGVSRSTRLVCFLVSWWLLRLLIIVSMCVNFLLNHEGKLTFGALKFSPCMSSMCQSQIQLERPLTCGWPHSGLSCCAPIHR